MDQPQQDKKPGGDGSRPEKRKPGRLSQAQIHDLLDAERENEKPFQMHKFVIPTLKHRDKKVDKDW